MQNLAICNLIFIYDNRPKASVIFTCVYVAIVLVLLSPFTPLSFLTFLEMMALPLATGGKVNLLHRTFHSVLYWGFKHAATFARSDRVRFVLQIRLLRIIIYHTFVHVVTWRLLITLTSVCALDLSATPTLRTLPYCTIQHLFILSRLTRIYCYMRNSYDHSINASVDCRLYNYEKVSLCSNGGMI